MSSKGTPGSAGKPKAGGLFNYFQRAPSAVTPATTQTTTQTTQTTPAATTASAKSASSLASTTPAAAAAAATPAVKLSSGINIKKEVTPAKPSTVPSTTTPTASATTDTTYGLSSSGRKRKQIKYNEDDDDEFYASLDLDVTTSTAQANSSTPASKRKSTRKDDDDDYAPSDSEQKPEADEDEADEDEADEDDEDFQVKKKQATSRTKQASATPATTKSVSAVTSSSSSSSSRAPNQAEVDGAFARFKAGTPTVTAVKKEKPSPKTELSDGGEDADGAEGEQKTEAGHTVSSWLKDPCDKNRRRRGDPGYDPSKLFIPKEAWAGMTPGEKQYWEIKSENFDLVLFYKMGKFYELFDNDADIGVKELGLNYMVNSSRAHAGFPEAAHDKYASQLIDLGYTVGRVEQTETPKMLAEANKHAKGPKRKAVAREIVSISTAGTLTDLELLKSEDAIWCMSIAEVQINHDVSPSDDPMDPKSGQTPQVCIGVCFFDTSTGKIGMGQFEDDEQRSNFRTLLGQFTPAEIIVPSVGFTPATQHVLKRSVAAGINEHPAPQLKVDDIINQLRKEQYFFPRDNLGNIIAVVNEEEEMKLWPPVVIDAYRQNKDVAIVALGQAVHFLHRIFKDCEILSLKNFFEYSTIKGGKKAEYMALDGQTLKNLEITVNGDGKVEGTLLKHLDHCQTAFGRRLLKQWVIRPLATVESINERFDAVKFFLDNPEVRNKMRVALKSLPDLDRLLTRIHANGMKKKVQAIMYENVDKKKIQTFVDVLKGFENSSKVVAAFTDCQSDLQTCSSLLLNLTTVGAGFPDISDELEHFAQAFDKNQATRNGYIEPAPGVNDVYDQSVQDIQKCEAKLDAYLKKQREKFADPTIKWAHKTNETYQLEISQKTVTRVGKSLSKDYEQKSSTKDVRRYWTSEISELVDQLDDAKERRNEAFRDTSRQMFAEFSEHYAKWKKVIDVLSELDCLQSLSVASEYQASNGESTRPVLVDINDNDGKALLELRDCSHPVLSSQRKDGKTFVPNDTVIGASENPSRFVLVSGPNMGGKSTLLRQTCIAVIMAQIGCFVPASTCKLTPVDRIFTRVGANDKIMEGQSTFLVELTETSHILKNATSRSLVILDELGRGTSTFDGTAIAHSVIKYLSSKVGCLTLFSTHFHMLMEEFAHDQLISMYHMACDVKENQTDVTFLYKFKKGICPKSYGMNVAGLAGLPSHIVHEATRMSREFEERLELAQKKIKLITQGNDMEEQDQEEEEEESEDDVTIRYITPQGTEACLKLSSLSSVLREKLQSSVDDQLALKQVFGELQKLVLD